MYQIKANVLNNVKCTKWNQKKINILLDYSDYSVQCFVSSFHTNILEGKTVWYKVLQLS